MPLDAHRHIRKMRGGAQSHLLEADDGKCYVVKFRNNPQHPRILVNELICSAFLKYLRITTPDTALIRVTEEFLGRSPELHLALGTQRVPVQPGWHFGSCFPGNPDTLAVYDYLPDSLLAKVRNLHEFRAVLVFDKWISNADGRQCVFYRARLPGCAPPSGWVAQMIDQGFAFNGPHWEFVESGVQGLYARKLVYGDVQSLDDFQPWLDQVVNFPVEVVDRAYKQVPPQWIEGEEDRFEALLEDLMRRRARVPELILACRDAKTSPFPNWH